MDETIEQLLSRLTQPVRQWGQGVMSGYVKPAFEKVREAITPKPYEKTIYAEQGPSPTQAPMPTATPTPTAMPSPTMMPQATPSYAPSANDYDLAEIERKIIAALTEYGGQDLPLLNFVPQMLEAAQRYPIFQQNPYLLPEVGILESSGGRNVTRPNSPFNWGINYPGNLEAYEQMTPEEILERMITGLGERMPAYEQFRTNQPLTDEEIRAFSNTYVGEPGAYDNGRSLSEGMKWFGGF